MSSQTSSIWLKPCFLMGFFLFFTLILQTCFFGINRIFHPWKKIEHIGIAVKDLESSNQLFEKLLGNPHYKIEEVASEGVKDLVLSLWPQQN